MKTIIFKLFFAVVLISGFTANAEEPLHFDIKKEKSINKVYQVNPDAGIDITNKFGNVYVTTWNEDRIALDIVIKVSGKSEKKVQERLDKINVDINPLKNLVTAVTKIESMSGNNISMEINYTIKIPRKGNVTLSNHYGNIIIDKIEERSDIDCQYGNFTAEELGGDSNSIKLKYSGKTSIGFVKTASINAGYSTVAINKSGNLVFKSDYSNLTLKEAANVNYSSDYGNVSLGNALSVKGNGNYLNIKIGTVNGALDIETRYSTLDVKNIAANAKNIAIDGAYTGISIQYDADYAFDYECTLKYSSLSGANLTSQIKRESGSSSYYKGYYKSAGSNSVKITSSYGNVRLTKN